MAGYPLSCMFDALTKLEAAVEAAAKSIHASNIQDKAVLDRISSYKEIVRRQRALIADMQKASARKDWKEVERITNLLHGASLMIKVDAGFLISNLRNRNISSAKAQ